jgi:hypothetical protein
MTMVGAWSGWYILGEGAFSQTAGLAVTSRYQNNIECFAMGQDNVIRVRGFNDGKWGDWYILGQGGFSQTAGLAVTSRYQNNIECFAMGQDNVIRYRSFDGQNWGGWNVLGEAGFSQTAGLAVTSRYQGNIECFAMGQDNMIRVNAFHPGPRITELDDNGTGVFRISGKGFTSAGDVLIEYRFNDASVPTDSLVQGTVPVFQADVAGQFTGISFDMPHSGSAHDIYVKATDKPSNLSDTRGPLRPAI